MSKSLESTSVDEVSSFGVPWPHLNQGLFYKDIVTTSDSEVTLIDFYTRKYNNSAPLLGWLQRIHNGQIKIDGMVVKEPHTKLRVGSELVYHRLPWTEPDAPFLLQVLYEDDHMIALNKPSGLQVLPGGLFQQRTVLTQLQWRAGEVTSSQESQDPHPAPVHRLGRGTSGILLCAKPKLAKTRLSAYFADGTSLIRNNCSDNNKRRSITKIYRALVDGLLQQDKVIINQPIGTVRYPGVAKGLYIACDSGKSALSKVEVLERNVQKNHTLVQVDIESGRPHQIRIHLSFIGHPLLGDPLYMAGGIPKFSETGDANESFALDGGYERPEKPLPGDCGYFLHAHQLVVLHPFTSQVIKVVAPLPSILQTQVEGTKDITTC